MSQGQALDGPVASLLLHDFQSGTGKVSQPLPPEGNDGQDDPCDNEIASDWHGALIYKLAGML